MNNRDLLRTGLILAAGGFGLAACASPGPNPALEQAQAAYASASNDPLVPVTAPDELADSADALKQAQAAWKDGDKVVADHNAYLAQECADTAVELAKLRASAQQVANAARIISLPRTLFATDKAYLNSQGLHAAKELANFLSVRADRSVMITGYTDSTGPADLNAALSQDRANAVKAALVADGIDPFRLGTRGLGPADPVASNWTAAGRQANRRVEVAISQAPTSPERTAAAQTRTE